MAGINHFYDEYKKRPRDIEKLLNAQVCVSEQLNGSRFSVTINTNGTFSYFRRDNSQITKIDRSVSNYYEKAINHFESFAAEKFATIPDNWKFGFEYFPTTSPLKISYDVVPLNNLVITDIIVKNPSGKILEVVTDKDTLTEWAEILEVEVPPIIFEGKLSQKQKEKILDFLNTPEDALQQRFSTENFTKFFLTLIDPTLKTSFLRIGIESTIEGLVFRFDNKVSLKISDPQTLSKASQVKVENQNSDMYNLVLLVIGEFLQKLDFSAINLRTTSFEDRYIEFISKAFNKFCASKEYKLNFEKGFQFILPSYMTKSESVEKFKFVTNKDTQNLLSLSSTNKELFKIILASYRTHKRKAQGMFTQDLLIHHNGLVDKISGHISKLNEGFSFDDFSSVMINESTEEEEIGISTAELNDILAKLETEETKSIGSKPNALKCLQEAFTKVEDTKPRVCLFRGSFMPFHNGHLTCIKDAAEDTGMKVFLLVQKNSINKEIGTDLLKEILEEVVAMYPKFICGYEISDKQFTTKIKNYGVGAVCGTEPFIDAYSHILPDAKCISITDQISSKTVLKSIYDDNQADYNKLVPKHMHKYYYKIKNEIIK